MQVGIIKELWRYPVKSMLGESLEQVRVTEAGVFGDRQLALAEVPSGHILSAKKYPQLLNFRAFIEPGPEASGRIVITAPDGSRFCLDEAADCAAALSERLGVKVAIVRGAPDCSFAAGIDPDTVFADVPVEKMVPGLRPGLMPASFGLLQGTLFDSAPFHFLTTASLQFLRQNLGGDSLPDTRRFRPNCIVDTDAHAGASLLEDTWVGASVRIGRDLRLTLLRPALRCVMTTHRQDELPRDLRVLRAIAGFNRGHFGVFCAVETPGTVTVGDSVVLCR